jgi:hypothetical protein
MAERMRSCSVDELERAIAAGELGCITIGDGRLRRHRRLTDALVADWLDSRTLPAASQASTRAAVATSRRVSK